MGGAERQKDRSGWTWHVVFMHTTSLMLCWAKNGELHIEQSAELSVCSAKIIVSCFIIFQALFSFFESLTEMLRLNHAKKKDLWLQRAFFFHFWFGGAIPVSLEQTLFSSWGIAGAQQPQGAQHRGFQRMTCSLPRSSSLRSGGTWGAATSHLASGFPPKEQGVASWDLQHCCRCVSNGKLGWWYYFQHSWGMRKHPCICSHTVLHLLRITGGESIQCLA